MTYLNAPDAFLNKVLDEFPLLKNGQLFNLEKFFEAGHILDKDKLNVILNYWNLPSVSNRFFNYYFKQGEITSANILIQGIQTFVRDAVYIYDDLDNGIL